MRFVIRLYLIVMLAFSVPIGQKYASAVEQPFFEGMQFFVDRLETYYSQNGHYASAEGKRRFTDIGLNPRDWDGVSYQGIVYDPRGSLLEIRPAQGYTFFVKAPSGATRILSHDLRWGLIYNLKDQKWYFYRIAPELAVDISSLLIKKDTPYNPEDYK